MVPNFLARLLVFLIPAAILVAAHSDVGEGVRAIWRMIQKGTGIGEAEDASVDASVDKDATNRESFAAVADDTEKADKNEKGKKADKDEKDEKDEECDGGDGGAGRRKSSCSNIVAFDADASMSLACEDFDKLPGMYREQRKEARRLSLKRNEWASALIEQRQMEELALACKTLSSCERRRRNLDCAKP